MACRHMRIPPPARPGDEWVPLALRDAICSLRTANPRLWTDTLRRHGVPADETDVTCRHNLEGSWESCPLYREGRAPAGPHAS
ncbi:MAG: hypothetical protein D6718_13265 [Acidobacteria bacterium]|nr:MAG: hypothetical protein D6718_13265 [Acidobacteriota bacterium]